MGEGEREKHRSERDPSIDYLQVRAGKEPANEVHALDKESKLRPFSLRANIQTTEENQPGLTIF